MTIRKPLWTKNYILILVNNFFVFMIHFALFTNLPAYVKSIGGNNTLAGLTTTIYTLSALATRPLFGFLTDKIGRKKVTIIGMVISLVVAVLFFFSNTTVMILVLRVFSGIGFCALGTAIGTLVADNVPSERLAEGIGYNGISLTVSTAVGPALGVAVIKGFGYKALFIYVFLVTCISFFCSMLVKYKTVQNNEEVRKTKLISAIFERSSLKPSLIIVVLALSFGSVATFMSAFGEVRELGNIGLFFIVYAFVALIVRVGTGRVADEKGVNLIFWSGLIALFLAYISLAFTHSLPLFVIASIFYGIGYGISFPMINVMVMKACPENRRGAAVAMLYAGMDIGIGVGALIWGVVSQSSGFTLVYILSAAVVAVASLLYYILIHKEMKLDYKV